MPFHTAAQVSQIQPEAGVLARAALVFDAASRTAAPVAPGASAERSVPDVLPLGSDARHPGSPFPLEESDSAIMTRTYETDSSPAQEVDAGCPEAAAPPKKAAAGGIGSRLSLALLEAHGTAALWYCNREDSTITKAHAYACAIHQRLVAEGVTSDKDRPPSRATLRRVILKFDRREFRVAKYGRAAAIRGRI